MSMTDLHCFVNYIFRLLAHLHPEMSLPLQVQIFTKDQWPEGKSLVPGCPRNHCTHGFPLANTLTVSLTKILGNTPPHSRESSVTASDHTLEKPLEKPSWGTSWITENSDRDTKLPPLCGVHVRMMPKELVATLQNSSESLVQWVSYTFQITLP